MAKLTDTTFLESAPPDPADGVLRGVKLLGAESRNNRRYSATAMQEAAARYSGIKVYIDHPRSGEAERSLDRWAGTIQNAHYREGGIYGDVKLRTKSPFFEGIIEAAREFPKDVGFSHVAEGTTKLEGETEIVESIKEIFSVDLVTDPATTAGLFESRQKMKTQTVSKVVETAKASKWSKLLKEHVARDKEFGKTELEVPENGNAVTLAIESAAAGIVAKTLAGELKESEAVDSLRDLFGVKKESIAPVEQPPKTDDKIVEELQGKLARMEAKTMLLESGREATDARVKALAACDEEGREELLESWPVKESANDETDDDGEYRPDRSPPKFTESFSESAKDFDFSNVESFARRYR